MLNMLHIIITSSCNWDWTIPIISSHLGILINGRQSDSKKNLTKGKLGKIYFEK